MDARGLQFNFIDGFDSMKSCRRVSNVIGAKLNS